METLFGLNEFNIYKDNQSTTLHHDYEYSYKLPFEKVHDKVGWTRLFQTYWGHSITVSIVYYIAIRVIQSIMRNREAFVLQRPLFFWNFGLALFSIAGFVRFAEDFFVAWYNNGLEYSLCHSCNPDGVAAFWSLAFAISKIVELGDTLFIVLRKKPLIFLHYYHHAAVLVYTVHSAHGVAATSEKEFFDQKNNGTEGTVGRPEPNQVEDEPIRTNSVRFCKRKRTIEECWEDERTAMQRRIHELNNSIRNLKNK
uniref:Elongation of very long chain fatty acids protein n=1 Tax=Bursaphelenchus xylophilus TaxID=6326 RepID=A0A1I7SR84_BURXY